MSKLFYTKTSKIQGKGNFASEDLNENIDLGIGIIKFASSGNPDTDYKRYAICTYTNHSSSPNVKIIKNKNKYHFYTKRKIKKGEELTVNYNEFDFEGEREFAKESYCDVLIKNIDTFIQTCESNIIPNNSIMRTDEKSQQ